MGPCLDVMEIITGYLKGGVVRHVVNKYINFTFLQILYLD